jgi:plastocyanin
VRRQLIVLAAGALLAVAACSGTSATTAPTAAPTAAATAASTAAPPAAAPSAAASAAPSTGGGGGAVTAVTIKNFAFSPASVNAKAGDKVTWTNGDDTAHTVTFDDAAMQGSGNLNTGLTFEFTFDKAGAYPYHCKIHPTMKGTVTVS